MAKVSLKGMTRKQLEKLGADVKTALTKVGKSEMKTARAAAEKAAKSHGFSLAELSGSAPVKTRRAKKAVKKAAPKYANPADSSQTWTGKGRRPQWFRDNIAAGKSADDLSIG